jgi:hypothetical protein
MSRSGIASIVILLLLVGVRGAGDLAGIGDLQAYYNDFQTEAPVPKPRPKPVRQSVNRGEPTRFPNREDALIDGTQYQQFYDTPYQSIVEGIAKIPMLPDGQTPRYQSTPDIKKPTQKQRANIAAEVQASRRSAITALGMDPNAMMYSEHGIPGPLKGTQVNGLTFYAGNTPSWANIEKPGVLAHEASHRGFDKLVRAGIIPRVSPSRDELLVQHLMKTKLGNPLTDAVNTSSGDPGSTMDLDQQLAEFEARAAKYLAQNDPAGPR